MCWARSGRLEFNADDSSTLPGVKGDKLKLELQRALPSPSAQLLKRMLQNVLSKSESRHLIKCPVVSC
jgi:hypothetical protein